MNVAVIAQYSDERGPLSTKRRMKLLTTKEVAERLSVTIKRVQAMILSGRLPAEKMGRDWFIKEEDLKLVAERKPGRPSATDKQKRAKKSSTKSKKGGATK